MPRPTPERKSTPAPEAELRSGDAGETAPKGAFRRASADRRSGRPARMEHTLRLVGGTSGIHASPAVHPQRIGRPRKKAHGSTHTETPWRPPTDPSRNADREQFRDVPALSETRVPTDPLQGALNRSGSPAFRGHITRPGGRSVPITNNPFPRKPRNTQPKITDRNTDQFRVSRNHLRTATETSSGADIPLRHRPTRHPPRHETAGDEGDLATDAPTVTRPLDERQEPLLAFPYSAREA
jgi:hypothetical protein